MSKTKMPTFNFSKRYSANEVREWLKNNKNKKIKAIRESDEDTDYLSYICHVYCLNELRRAPYTDCIPFDLSYVLDIDYSERCDNIMIEFRHECSYWDHKMAYPVTMHSTNSYMQLKDIDEFANGEPNKHLLDEIEEMNQLIIILNNYNETYNEIEKLTKKLNQQKKNLKKVNSIIQKNFPDLDLTSKIPYQVKKKIKEELSKKIENNKAQYELNTKSYDNLECNN